MTKCILCGKEFTPKDIRAKICYDDHYKQCVICGKKFKVRRNYYKQSTCSAPCSRILRKKNAEKTSLERYGVKNAGNTLESQKKIKDTNRRKYGCDYAFQSSEVKQRIKDTNLKKYGVENPNQLEEIKLKTRHTCLERYGDTSVLGKNSSVRSSIIASNIEKYGTVDPGNLPQNLEKRKQTNLKRYGKEWFPQTDEFKKKVKLTSQLHWGTDHPMKSQEVKDRVAETFEKKYGSRNIMGSEIVKQHLNHTIQEKYGVDWACQLPQCFKASGMKISKINEKFGNFLSEFGIEYEFEYTLVKKSYDFKIKDQNILIEINPTWSHTTESTKFGGLDKSYHKSKLQLAEDSGFRCINIWDWDDWDKLIGLISQKKILRARNLIVKEVSSEEASRFLNKYHLQDTCRGQDIILGLYEGNNLLELMSFGNPRYSKSHEYELLRLCTKSGYAVTGGANKLFKHFIRNYEPTSIVSYCDRSKFGGQIYSALGFKLDTWNEPSCHWSKGKHHITDNLLRQRGYDQLFKTHYGKGSDNKSLMLQNGWLPVYDCGQARYSWRKQDA